MKRTFKPYSSLPEPFLLMAALVWIDLLAAAWSNVTAIGFAVRVVVYGGLVAAASSHSWYFTRRSTMANPSHMIAITFAWLVVLGTLLAWLEADTVQPLVGLLAFLQIVQCSFLFNHMTLRLAHVVAFIVMLASSPRLPLVGGGTAWLAFAVLSMFVLAYDRTAVKSGPAGYDQFESRRTSSRVALVSCVAIVASLLFFVLPLLKWPEAAKIRIPSRPNRPDSSSRREPVSRDPFGIGGSTGMDHRDDDLEVMLVSTDPPIAGPLYVRGQVFDTFDGVDWSDTASHDGLVNLSGGAWATLPFASPNTTRTRFKKIKQTYQMSVNMRNVVFTAFRPTSVRFPDSTVSQIRYGADQSLVVDQTLPAYTRYEVDGFQESFSYSSLVNVSYTANDYSPADLAIPTGIDPRVKEIARQRTERYASNYEKALALETFLRDNFYYSLDHDVSGSQIVNDFLLDKKRGHCALFASSMVVMARSVGIPARYVTGFLAQDRRTDGFHVKGTDGHAWVEVYVPSAGWIAFDPTSGRIASDDEQTRAMARNGRPSESRVDDQAERGGGLYGRDGSDYRPSGMGDTNAGGAGESGNGSAGQGGQAGQAGGAGGTGDVARNDAGTPGGGTPSRESGSPTGSPAGSPTGASGNTSGGQPAGTSGSASDPNRTVIAPGGSTTLPKNASANRGGSAREPERVSGGSDRPASGTQAPIKKEPDPLPPDPEQMASDWQLLVVVLLIFGVAGLMLLLVWKNGVQRVVERRQIREALPLSVDDDPDPRRLVVNLYHTMVAGLGRVGFPKRDSDTPAEFATEVGSRQAKLAEPVGELTELFQAVRYGDRLVTSEDARSARGIWHRIATSVKTVDNGR